MTEEPIVNKIEVPIIKGNQPKNHQEIAHERRMEIAKSIVSVLGLKNAMKRIKALAEHYKVSERRIYQDFDWIKGNFRPADLQAIKMDLRIARDRILEEAMQLLEGPGFKAEAIETLIKASKHYREEMEAWGEKEKIAEKVEHIGAIPVTFNEVTKSVEEIKDERKRNKPGKADTAEPQGTGDARHPG